MLKYILLIATAAAAQVWDGTADTTWYTNDTSKTEFTITTPQQLAGLALLVNGSEDNGTYDMEGKTIKLGNNITLNDNSENYEDWETNPPDNSWTAIGTYNNDIIYLFRGTFDGDGHVISGVYINSTRDSQGLFGYNGGTIKNLGVITSYIKGGYSVGGLVGNNIGTISNSYSTGAVTGDGYVGGLVGTNNDYGTVSNSYATGAVSGSGWVGGLVGYNNAGTVSNSYYDKETSGQTDTGKGEGKTTVEMQSQDFTDNLNFIAGVLSMNAWVYSEGKYPVLSNTLANFNFANYFENGNGTETNPYVLKTKEELEYLSFFVNQGQNFNGKYFKLGNDIVLNDTIGWQNWGTTPPANSWTAIGNYNNQFQGIFDGDGHVVSGVYINSTRDYQGLFGYSTGTIKNVGVVASYIKGSSYVGGLVGYNRSGTVSNSYSVGIVTGTGSDVGGLVGNGATVNNSYSTGTVTGGAFHVGGLVGSGGAVNNSYSTGTVTGNYYVGGLVGHVTGNTVSNSYSTGAVTGNSGVGGLVGGINGGTVINSYYDTQTSGQTDTRGIGKTTAEMQSQGFASLLNVRATLISMNAWVHSEGKYPVLTNRPANINDVFASEDGTAENPYIIKTKEQLEAFSLLVNALKDFSGEYIKLGNDIALNDTTGWQNWKTTPPAYSWAAIGNYNNQFQGIFDGDGHTISGVYINRAYDRQGLFGYLGEGGIIKNLGVVASYIRGSSYVGGLVGYQDGGTISNSYATGAVTGTDYVGGLVGIGSASNSYATGAVTGTRNVGGLVGSGSATNSYATGAVTGTRNVGGLAGYGGIISNSYSAGIVTGTENVGGLVGSNSNSWNVSNSYYDSQTSGQTDVGKGIGKTTAEMQSNEFARLLNAGAASLSMNAWVYTEGKYPVLSNAPANSEINVASYFESGNGTATNPYIIKTKAQMEAFSLLVSSLEKDFKGEYIKLGNDIALNDTTGWQDWDTIPPAYYWAPIGSSYNNSFKGTFDGDGNVISGVYINTTSRYQGLFRYLGDGGTIKNLGVVNSYIKGWSYVGGLVGSNYRGTISNCYSTGTMSVAGIAGGLVGSNEGTVSNSYSSVTITGTSYYVGGLVGVNYGGTVSNSYATGAVTAVRFVGGLLGINEWGTVSNSYYNSETSGQTDTGKGEGKTTAEMKQIATYVGWDFEGVWKIDSTINNGYPYLNNKTIPVIPKRAILASGNATAQVTGRDIVLGNLPQNAKIEAYNINGKRIYLGNVGVNFEPLHGALRITVPTKGIYIVRINNQTLKVTVR